MIDDLGWRNVGFMRSIYYKTSIVNTIGQNKKIFMNTYSANPLCIAIRASIITETWPVRNRSTHANGYVPEATLGFKHQENPLPEHKFIQSKNVNKFNSDYYTFANAFKDAGFATAHFGKWHTGEGITEPLNKGFGVDILRTNTPSPLSDGWLAPWPFWPGKGSVVDFF